ncbi:MAG: sulfite exporter TauE/SafE family protein [Geminicoccaceae bacterium]
MTSFSQVLPLTATEALLVGVAFLISIWNTSVGPSGAVTFVTMATLLPPAAVVPIHAVTEAVANVVRTAILRDVVDWRFVLPFALGGLLGFACGVPLLSTVAASEALLQVILGSFILIATWVPLARLGPEKGVFAATGGAVSSFLTLFVGATTPLVAAAIGQRHADHRKVIDTSAGCMLYQHAFKIPIFGVLGFSFGAYAHLLIVLVAATTIGAWIGRQLLIKAPVEIIKRIFKAVITLLALNLLRQGLGGWIGVV